MDPFPGHADPGVFRVHNSGADPGFSWGGGGAQDYVRARTSRAQSPKSLTSRVHGLAARALEVLGFC